MVAGIPNVYGRAIFERLPSLRGKSRFLDEIAGIKKELNEVDKEIDNAKENGDDRDRDTVK